MIKQKRIIALLDYFSFFAIILYGLYHIFNIFSYCDHSPVSYLFPFWFRYFPTICRELFHSGWFCISFHFIFYYESKPSNSLYIERVLYYFENWTEENCCYLSKYLLLIMSLSIIFLLYLHYNRVYIIF